jgi:predicted transporter
MEKSEILNTDTLIWSLGIVSIIFIFRAIQLKLSGLPLKSLLFVSPRGLITILLFVSIVPSQRISFVNKAIIIQVILLTTFIMMFAIMISSRIKKKKNVEADTFEPTAVSEVS